MWEELTPVATIPGCVNRPSLSQTGTISNKEQVMADAGAKPATDVSAKIDALVQKSKKAAAIFKTYTQEQVDKICAAMDAASLANEKVLAEEAVAETGIGRADHKVIKNHLGAHVVYEYLKDKKSVGVIKEEP
ncbi:MAG TPA: hypothetical protein VF767_04855, partial [Bryobacteraceae bacterium]